MKNKYVEYRKKVKGWDDMLQIGICDDEMHTCTELENMLLEISREVNIKFSIEVWFDGSSLCDFLKNVDSFDIIFLDIELYTMSGVEVASYIRNELNDLRTSIIFISHKKNYAMELFKMQPLDFLVKPLIKNDISQVIKTFLRYHNIGNTFFKYKKGGNYYKKAYKDILYFRSNNRKIEIILFNGIEEFYGKLTDIVHLLPEYFLQIHKSYIINQSYVNKYVYEQLAMGNGDILSISREYRKKVREKIRKYKTEQLLGEKYGN